MPLAYSYMLASRQDCQIRQQRDVTMNFEKYFSMFMNHFFKIHNSFFQYLLVKVFIKSENYDGAGVNSISL